MKNLVDVLAVKIKNLDIKKAFLMYNKNVYDGSNAFSYIKVLK